MIEPIRVTETLKPVARDASRSRACSSSTWARTWSAGAGSTCPARAARRSRCATPRRSSRTARSTWTTSAGRKVTDTYTLKGKGTEVYEPRFTYHGFRFVEVTGYPGKPTPGRARRPRGARRSGSRGRVHLLQPAAEPDLPRTSSGACAAITAASRPIARSATSARAGWATVRPSRRGETYLFDIAALYAKWLQDMADAQKDERQRAGRLPGLLADLLRQRHLAEQHGHHPRHAARPVRRRARSSRAITPARRSGWTT